MRPIDADALKKALAEMWYENAISISGISVSELIDSAPTIKPIEDTKSCGVSADRHTDQNVADVPSDDEYVPNKSCFACMERANGLCKGTTQEQSWCPIITKTKIETDCEICRHNDKEWYSAECDSCCGNNSHYEPSGDVNKVQTSAEPSKVDFRTDKSANIGTKINPENVQKLHNDNLDKCNDLISRDKAICAIENTDCELTAKDWDELIDAIEAVPSADRPKGEWRWTHGGQCSECGFHNTNFDFNFCPSCGADMRPEK